MPAIHLTAGPLWGKVNWPGYKEEISMQRWVITSSSRGTVLKQLILRCPQSIYAIVTDRPCPARDLALEFNIPHYDFHQSWFDLPQDIPVLLSGFKKILKAKHLQSRRVYNLHPSFLPLHSGWDESVHLSVLNSKQKLTAVTLHRVDETVDGGEILWQFPIPVFHEDTVLTLKERCQKVEVYLARQLLSHSNIENPNFFPWWNSCAEFLDL